MRRWRSWLGLMLVALAACAWWAKPRVLAWRHRTVCAERNDEEACVLACLDGVFGERGCLAAAKRDGKWTDGARDLLAVACRGGELVGCVDGARLIRASQPSLSQIARTRLRFDPLHAELSQRGCDLGDLASCVFAANDWLEHDPAQWRRAVEQRCKLLPDAVGSRVCKQRYAAFVASDAKLAATCKQGNAGACNERALLLLDLHLGAAVQAFGQECAARGIVRGYDDEPCAEGCPWYDGNVPESPLDRCGLARAEQWHDRAARVLPAPLAIAARPDLKVTLAEVKQRRGTFDDAEGVLGAETVLAALRGCYAEAVARKSAAAANGGKIGVRVVVDALGDAERTMPGNSDVPDRALITCFRQRLEDVHFSALGDGERLIEASYAVTLDQ